MSKGFGRNQALTAQEAINNLQKNRKLLRNNFTQKRNAFQSGWLAEFKDREYSKVPEHNLYTPYSEHSCLIAQKPSKSSTVGHHNDKILYFANTDFWSVLVRQTNYNNHLFCTKSINNVLIPKQRKKIEFQISVKVGAYAFFIPSLIKQRINNWYGDEAYSTWRQMVKADLANLFPYLSAYNPPVTLHSIVSEESSARVCQSLGFHVKHGVAYWMKKDKSSYKPQVTADVVEGTAQKGLVLPNYLNKTSNSNLNMVTRFNMAFENAFQSLIQLN